MPKNDNLKRKYLRGKRFLFQDSWESEGIFAIFDEERLTRIPLEMEIKKLNEEMDAFLTCHASSCKEYACVSDSGDSFQKREPLISHTG